MLYEPKRDSRKDAGSTWWLVYGEIQYKSTLPTVNIGLLRGHYFYIRKIDAICNQWEYKGCEQIFTQDKNLIKHLKDKRSNQGKPKIKFRHILNSSEKVFYGGGPRFS